MENLNLKALRISKEISLAELVQKMDKSRSHLERVEKEPKNYRIVEVEQYLKLLGYDIDIISFIYNSIYPQCTMYFTKEELNSAVEVERKRTVFYHEENLRLLNNNEKLKKEIENYKEIILNLTTEKYCK